jgi:hypothetical protein
MSIYSTFILQGMKKDTMMTNTNKTIARQMLSPFFSGNGLDSAVICTNVQSLKAVVQALDEASI